MRITAVPALVGLLVGTIGLLPAAGRAAPSLDAYALSVGGNSILGAAGPLSCATFGPDPRAALYGGGFQVGLPTDGSICGVGSDSRTATASAGSVQAASTLAVGFGAPADPRAFTGSSAGRAAFGNLGARASATYSGNTDAFTLIGAQAGAHQVEGMTFGGASGNGTFRPTFTIDGSLFGVGRGYSDLEFSYSLDSGPTFLAFRILDSYGSVSLYANGSYQASLPGMSISGDLANGYTVAGSTTFALNIPIVFGVATDVTYNLWAAVLPGSSANQLGASSGDVSFMSTARMTGIEVFDGSGQPVGAFSITSASGTVYGPDGVSPVPAPAAAWLWAVGLAGLALRRRWGARPA